MVRYYPARETRNIQTLRSNSIHRNALGMLLATSALVFAWTLASAAQVSPRDCGGNVSEIAVMHIEHEPRLDAANPAPEWQSASSIEFCTDWQGKNADPERKTRVKALWTEKTLYLRFECSYRTLHVFSDSDPNGRRDHLWDRDVAETFLQPDPSHEHFYKEFEVSPNGMWIDLDIGSGELVNLQSGLTRSVAINENSHTWAAELAIPMGALTPKFDPDTVWRTNFFRVEGQAESRFYAAWRPTNTPQPNFHVPSAFGRMRFVRPLKPNR